MDWTKARTVGPVLALFAALMLLGACGGDDEENTGGGGGAQTGEQRAEGGGSDIVVGHVNPNLSNPILQALHLGQERAAATLGWEVRELDADLTPDKQVTHIDTLINLDVDGITTWTLDPGAVEAAYKRASDAGIPIVGFNSESEFINTVIRTELATTCSPLEYEAEYIAERIPNAKVLVLGPPPVPALANRVDCFTEAAEATGLEVLERQDNLEDTAQRGQELAQDLLTKHNDVQAIWAYNDPTALGAAAALRAAGKDIWSGEQDGVIVVGNNADSDAIEAIKAGTLTLTYDENTFKVGVEAVKALLPVLRDGEPTSAMPEDVLIEGEAFDVSNIDDWVPPEDQEPEMDGQ